MPQTLSVRKLFRRINSFLFIIILTAFFAVAYFLIWPVFQVKNIIINGVPSKAAVQGLGVLTKNNILFVSEDKTIKIIKEQNPGIKGVKVTKSYPNTLILDLELYKPAAYLQTTVGYAELAEDGRVLSKSNASGTGLPLLKYYQKINHFAINTGDWIDYKDILTSLRFLTKSRSLGLPVDAIDINGSDMIVFSLKGKSIVFTMNKSTDIQEYELEQLIRQFRIDGREYKAIDLRFDKPILKF